MLPFSDYNAVMTLFSQAYRNPQAALQPEVSGLTLILLWFQAKNLLCHSKYI